MGLEENKAAVVEAIDTFNDPDARRRVPRDPRLRP